MLLIIIWPHKKNFVRTGNPASVPKAKPCGILLVDFKREIIREWLGKEKTLSFEAQYTKIKKIPNLLVGRKKNPTFLG